MGRVVTTTLFVKWPQKMKPWRAHMIQQQMNVGVEVEGVGIEVCEIKPAAGEWLPMAAAPKDGRTFLMRGRAPGLTGVGHGVGRYDQDGRRRGCLIDRSGNMFMFNEKSWPEGLEIAKIAGAEPAEWA